MGIEIKATQAGFHLLSETSDTFSPDLFLRDDLNLRGRVEVTDGAANWISTTPGLGGLLMEFHTETILGQNVLGAKSTVSFSSATLYRYEDGKKVAIAEYGFSDAIEVTTTYDTLENSLNGWRADVGDTLSEMIKTQGFHFLGSSGVDIISPDHAPLYYTQTSFFNLRGGNDIATGTRGNDDIRGGRGNDIITDDYGANTIHGGDGNDIIQLGRDSEGSIARGGKGDDEIWSTHGHDKLIGGDGDDQIRGGQGRDTLKGGDGNDILKGDGGKDRIIGGEGEDWIYAGSGKDKITGGDGADHFVFFQNTDGRNIITDFEMGIDHIHLPDLVGSFEELIITQNGQHSWIRFENEELEIKLRNFDANDLSVDDFIFG